MPCPAKAYDENHSQQDEKQASRRVLLIRSPSPMSSTGTPAHAEVHALYHAHHGWLSGWLRGRIGCSQRAQDLAQDTFVRLMTHRRGVEPLREPRAFLTKVAHGLMVNQWRRDVIERAYLDALASHPEAVAPSPEVQAVLLETLQEVDRLLSQLRPRVREAFLMAQLDGLGYAQIGAKLGVSDRMVRKYMAQAMLHCLTADVIG